LKETPIQYYKNSLKRWYTLVHNQPNPFKSFTIPSMDQVQQRSASVLSVTGFQETKTTDGTLYTKLPVQHFDQSVW
jgi:lysophospholipid hydrolase